ncbi:hypothetical protein CH352_18865 [Leptospira hartskeerlii]|uniref:Uncharacterized protein n=2 Tax=Leptospira hartskeerlii TaxID=2023177 RepID=A0A2M9X876_9LEPT|nr:hypothetical protein CH357_18800 [Leptospira hartskeerlii]PJZ31918.1 hypothetical protein CH352_18865 [Leptospira hartskeerlii]
MAKRFLFSLLFIISCKEFGLDLDTNFGFDTTDVIRANDAYRKVIAGVSNKFEYCKSIGNTYSNIGGPSIRYCNGDTFLHNQGNYVWTRSVDTCLNLIHFTLCPESGTDFDGWQNLMIGSCHLEEAYFINSYKPFQGKLLVIPRRLYGLNLLCL